MNSRTTAADESGKLIALSKAQRTLIWSVLTLIIARAATFILVMIAGENSTDTVKLAVMILFGCTYFATFIFVLVAACRIGKALSFQGGSMFLVFIAMFLPLVNLITLILLDVLARGELRRAGFTKATLRQQVTSIS